MSTKNPLSLLEAVLFACGEPIEISKLAAGLSLDMAAIREQLSAYAERLQRSDSGMELLFLGDTVQLCSKRCYEEQVAAVLASRKNVPLSGAAMEVLAIIAYNQPVTKSFVEQVRGWKAGRSSTIWWKRRWWRKPGGWTSREGPSPTVRRRISSAASGSQLFRSCRPCPGEGLPAGKRSPKTGTAS